MQANQCCFFHCIKLDGLGSILLYSTVPKIIIYITNTLPCYKNLAQHKIESCDQTVRYGTLKPNLPAAQRLFYIAKAKIAILNSIQNFAHFLNHKLGKLNSKDFSSISPPLAGQVQNEFIRRLDICV